MYSRWEICGALNFLSNFLFLLNKTNKGFALAITHQLFDCNITSISCTTYCFSLRMWLCDYGITFHTLPILALIVYMKITSVLGGGSKIVSIIAQQ